jgi:hypothetical protein
MATREEAAAKLKELSSQVSTLIRTLSLGVLAIAWLFLSGGKDAPAIVVVIPKWSMLSISALCVLALGLDLLQYIVGYWNVKGDYERAKVSNEPNKIVYSDSFTRDFAFWAKITVVLISTLWLLIMLTCAITSQSKEVVKAPQQSHGAQTKIAR